MGSWADTWVSLHPEWLMVAEISRDGHLKQADTREKKNPQQSSWFLSAICTTGIDPNRRRGSVCPDCTSCLESICVPGYADNTWIPDGLRACEERELVSASKDEAGASG